MSARTLSYDTILEFERAVKHFFNAKNIAPMAQVSQILYNFNDSSILTWVESSPDLSTLSFADFMARFKTTWLSLDWEDDIVFRIVDFQGSHDFNTWVSDVRLANSLLANHPLHVPDSSLRAHIIARMSTELHHEYRRSDHDKSLVNIVEFNAWLHQVWSIDEHVHSCSREWLAAMIQVHSASTNITQQLNAASASFASHISAGPVAPNHPLPTPVIANSFPSSRPPPAGTPHHDEATASFPCLTEAQKLLLSSHRGCYKCREFYTDHISTGCPWRLATSTAINNCNEAGAAAALLARSSKTVLSLGAKNTPSSSAPTIIAAILNEDSDDDLYGDHGFPALDMSDGFEPYEYVPPPVPNVPSLSSTVLSPLPAHFWWDCGIDGPLTCSPTPVKALIDTGSPPVLISEECIELYGLVPHRLHKPLSVTGAYSAGGDIILDAYVKLHIFSLDSLWFSHVVPAIIVPGLHANIILGLDFLTRNRIVIDPEDHSAICKMDGYGLLNPPKPADFRKTPLLSPPLHQKLERHSIREGITASCGFCIAVHKELMDLFATHPNRFNFSAHTLGDRNIIGMIQTRIEQLAYQDRLNRLSAKFKQLYSDCFPSDIPHIDSLPTDIYHHIEVPTGASFSTSHPYSCPHKYRDAWKTLIEQHVAAGRIRPSSSPYASPSFIIPKADLTVLPHWVVDYHLLNKVTVPDAFPLPRIDDILADCAKGKIWKKINMTNSFFQTRMLSEHVKFTATLTPFGLWEWIVMPMGCRNAPATHQRRISLALKDHIGKFCHVYLDDIVIWLQSIDEHKKNVAAVLDALCRTHLYCSMKKSNLFCSEIDFLGHHISPRGIEADSSKVQCIMDLPQPCSAKDVRRFLGLVHYISAFLPQLAEHTSVLSLLTRKECNSDFLPWTPAHQAAFDAIKGLVLSHDCLTMIDHVSPGDSKIFMTCDASKCRTGSVLSFSPTLETARPVAFESRSLKGAELHYSTHEQELLSIIHALQKWRSDLLGSHFFLFTDHKTLQNFDSQKDLSMHQM